MQPLHTALASTSFVRLPAQNYGSPSRLSCSKHWHFLVDVGLLSVSTWVAEVGLLCVFSGGCGCCILAVARLLIASLAPRFPSPCCHWIHTLQDQDLIFCSVLHLSRLNILFSLHHHRPPFYLTFAADQIAASAYDSYATVLSTLSTPC